MDVSPGNTAVDPKQQREVPRQLDELSESINHLQDMVGQLTDKLNPILIVQPVSSEKAIDQPEAVLCDVASVIRTETSRIKNIISAVIELRQRLQV